jgi:hypothetical protein
VAIALQDFMDAGGNSHNGFYLYDYENLSKKLKYLHDNGEKIFLIGVTYALIDLFEKFPVRLPGSIIMETGGMKGKRKEIIRDELHSFLIDASGVSSVHSEYGMTELLSQAYSYGKGLYVCPPWMRVLIRDRYDPLGDFCTDSTGLINIIDLANIHSCSFLATQDLGRLHRDYTFEVLGRTDNSEIRGCNLMIDT